MHSHGSNRCIAPRLVEIGLTALTTVVLMGAAACGDPLPDDLSDYETRCIAMNPTPIPPTPDDPHSGFKTVYACNISEDVLEEGTRPFPEGTLIVKESIKEGEDAPWLIATARKGSGEGASR